MLNMSSENTDVLVEREVILVSSDDYEFKLPEKVAYLSGLVKSTLGGTNNDDGDDDDGASEDEDDSNGESPVIPLKNVSGDHLADVVKFMKFYATNPMPEIEKPIFSAEKFVENLGDDFYRDFTNKDQDYIFDMVAAANFMDVAPLLDLMCASVAALLKGKTPEQIKETFGIEADFTPEEEEKVAKENPWLEEL